MSLSRLKIANFVPDADFMSKSPRTGIWTSIEKAKTQQAPYAETSQPSVQPGSFGRRNVNALRGFTPLRIKGKSRLARILSLTTRG